MGAPNPERHSPHPLDDTLIEQFVKDWPGWIVVLFCRAPGCLHFSSLRPANLAVLPRPPKTWGEMRARLRCHGACGSRDFELLLRYDGHRRNG